METTTDLRTFVRLQIIVAIKQVAKEHQRALAPLSDDLMLLESGLDSLSLAVLVARLEDELMVDPFAERKAVDFPVTLGALVTAYERAVKALAADFPR